MSQEVLFISKSNCLFGCRCTSQFCYGCGAEWTSDHGGCQRD